MWFEFCNINLSIPLFFPTLKFLLHVPFRSDAVAQGRKILSTVKECGMNRFNDSKVFNHEMIRK